MADYRVEVYKRAQLTEQGSVDPFDDGAERESETSATDWEHCLALVRELARAHPDRIIAAYNADLCDCDDGLTDSERDQVIAAVEEARHG